MRYLISLLAAVLVLIFAFRSPQKFIVTGRVTDINGSALPGITVKEKNHSNEVITGSNGEYIINLSSKNGTLLFSGNGYATKEQNVAGRSSVNIVLSNAVQKADSIIGVSEMKQESIAYTPPKIAYDKSSSSGYYALSQKKGEAYNREGYDNITENRFKKVTDNPLSTFSIDVDAASYSNVRRFLQTRQLPPAGAVRIEEMVNYFHYDYPQPTGDDPFSVNTEIAACPWNADHRIALIGLQGKKIPVDKLPASNLVFLIDVSGSMMEEDKLPLVQQSLKLLADNLREQDKVSICVYAGATGMVLAPTSGSNKQKIKDAVNALEAGGSTAGAAGIMLAYKTAKENFVKGGNNRVILCTDGDFNVGLSSDDALERLIEEERKSGVFLSVLGFGTGNYQDAKMQKLADKGNGNHAYIDGLNEAKKVLISEFGGTLFTIAKDVKLQVEFNPALVQGYRLIGYENRILNKEDFNNDKKDAGDMGSGHTVTALYEIIPVGASTNLLDSTDKLKYQSLPRLGKTSFTKELMTIKLRYKKPDEDISKLLAHPVFNENKILENASSNFRFAAAVAEFGMLLRNSEFKQSSSYKNVIRLASNSLGKDEGGYRAEFLQLVNNANSLTDMSKR